MLNNAIEKTQGKKRARFESCIEPEKHDNMQMKLTKFSSFIKKNKSEKPIIQFSEKKEPVKIAESEFYCKICEKSFVLKSSMVRHNKNFH